MMNVINSQPSDGQLTPDTNNYYVHVLFVCCLELVSVSRLDTRYKTVPHQEEKTDPGSQHCSEEPDHTSTLYGSRYRAYDFVNIHETNAECGQISRPNASFFSDFSLFTRRLRF